MIIHPWIADNTSLPDKNTQEMWVTIAKRYQNDPTVIYDLLAEPRDATPQELEVAYNTLIPAVRKVNPRSLIMVTGLDLGPRYQ